METIENSLKPFYKIIDRFNNGEGEIPSHYRNNAATMLMNICKYNRDILLFCNLSDEERKIIAEVNFNSPTDFQVGEVSRIQAIHMEEWGKFVERAWQEKIETDRKFFQPFTVEEVEKGVFNLKEVKE